MYINPIVFSGFYTKKDEFCIRKNLILINRRYRISGLLEVSGTVPEWCRGLTQHWERTGNCVGASDATDAAAGVPTSRLVTTKSIKSMKIDGNQ